MECLILNSSLYFLSRLEHLYLLGTARASKYGDSYHRMRMRALFLRSRLLFGMAFHLFFLKVAALPATFPTPWRGHPNMTEQGYVYPGKFKAAYPILSVCVSWLSQLEWAGGWVCKDEA